MLRDKLRSISWLYGLALRFQLTGVGRDLHYRAKMKQTRLSCGLGGVCLGTHDREMWFRSEDATLAWAALSNFESFQRKLIFVNKGGKQVADCRGPQLYRLSGVADLVQLPTPPEPSDIISGYLLKGSPQEGETVFDGGAFCGELTLVMARKVGPTGRVVAFEPDVRNCAWLRRNVERMGFRNVTIVERGLWKETTTLRFAGNQGWISRLDTTGTGGGTVAVPVVSFEEACRLAGCVPDFVKMDIEGAEVETLEAAKEFLRGQRIRFSIASYHDRGGRPTSEILEPLFREAGYQVETGFPEHPTTWAWKS